MVISAGILLALGSLHLVYTFWGSRLTPLDPALKVRMSEVPLVLTKETTMWKAWIGFNASHSMAAILFGLIYGYLAIARIAVSLALPAHRRAGHAGRPVRSGQDVLVQRPVHRDRHLAGLLCRQPRGLASPAMVRRVPGAW